MKCRKGDYATLKNGKTVYIFHGTNKNNGWILVSERFDDWGGGHCYQVSRNAGDIVRITRGGKIYEGNDIWCMMSSVARCASSGTMAGATRSA